MTKKKPSSALSVLTLKVKVEPGSSKSEVVGPYGDALKIKLTSSPVEGKANRELTALLAKKFGTSKKNVEIVSGQSSKIKIVRLYGISNMNNSSEQW